MLQTAFTAAASSRNQASGRMSATSRGKKFATWWIARDADAQVEHKRPLRSDLWDRSAGA